MPMGSSSRLNPGTYTVLSLYIAPLQSIIESHGLHVMFYADDTQLYLTSEVDKLSLPGLEQCDTEIRSLYTQNKFKYNQKKTQLLCLHSRYRQQHLQTNDHTLISVEFDNHQIHPLPAVKNLGIVMDCHFTLESQAISICKSAITSTRSIARIRAYLDERQQRD